MPKQMRPRTDSLNGVLAAIQGSTSVFVWPEAEFSKPECPERAAIAQLNAAAIYKSRASADWLPRDLIVIAQLATIDAAISAEQKILDVEGYVVYRERSNGARAPIANPRATTIQTLQSRSLSLQRMLGLNANAPGATSKQSLRATAVNVQKVFGIKDTLLGGGYDDDSLLAQ